jgi:hypothetical protein
MISLSEQPGGLSDLSMKRIGQGTVVIVASMAALTAALALAQVGSIPEKRCALDAVWLGCAMAAHENLAGGLIGAAGTVFAGWVAWVAIERQIAIAERLGLREETEAEAALQEILRERFNVINEIWQGIDWALQEADEEERERKASLAIGMLFYALPNEADAELVERMGLKLPPRRAARLNNISATWRRHQLIEKQEAEGDRGHGLHWRARRARTMFSHMERYAREYDSQLTAIFNDRIKAPVDHSQPAEDVRTSREIMIQEYTARR